MSKLDSANICYNMMITGFVGTMDDLLGVNECPSIKASDNNPSSDYRGH